jgi:hypothetical protein
MSAKILQVNFKFNVPGDAYEQDVSPMADQFATVRGCRRKIWLMNETEREAGGIYQFEDDASLKTFLEGPPVAAVVNHPALSDFSVKQFDVMEAVTKITRGPIQQIEKASSASVSA